jgi:hypothetical protein
MTEFRRLKMKVGDAEFEADVPESNVQPMYDQFLSLFERRSQTPVRLAAAANGQRPDSEATVQAKSAESAETDSRGETFDQALLPRIFDLREDGAVTLKVLPTGPDKGADALLLLLYGYHRLKNEQCVLATHLRRAAEQSGISMRRPANELARNGRFVIRSGHRKGSNYALNSQGLAMAKETTVKIVG